MVCCHRSSHVLSEITGLLRVISIPISDRKRKKLPSDMLFLAAARSATPVFSAATYHVVMRALGSETRALSNALR